MSDNDKPQKNRQNKEEKSKDWFTKPIDRKDFLKKTQKLSLLLGGGLVGSSLTFACNNTNKVANTPTPHTPSKTKEYPFQLGVASGDPFPDGVVLWTRLAPKPLTADGGMKESQAEVIWEVAEDSSFNRVVQQGKVGTDASSAHSVHVELEGLAPYHTYYYRFIHGKHVSPVGRTKTAPAKGSGVDNINFAFASCQHYPSGYYTAYKHLAREDLDVVFFLGDYIYQDGGQGHLQRGHIPQHTTHSLLDYRIRHAQYKSNPLLQNAHAAFPWVVTIDDHEIKNNWAGDYANEEGRKGLKFQDRKTNAFQAYYEHMPLRSYAKPDLVDIEMQLYRSLTYGDLAEFNVLDTRQFRSAYACGGDGNNCSERFDPSRTMLGDEQEEWLYSTLKQSTARWNILPQQVLIAKMDRDKGPGENYSMDKWDGYVATRRRLFDVVKQHDVSNFVVLTGDYHRNIVSDLLEDFTDPDSPVLGSELLGTSISSAGNGANITASGKKYLAENPWIKFVNRQRGYVTCQVTPDKLKADFKVMPYVEKKGAPIDTRASFIIRNGQPGIEQV